MIADRIIVHTPKGDMRLPALLYGILWNNPNSADKKFEELSKRYSFTELGAGYLFADCFKDIARYVPERKKWFIYDKVWAQDQERIMELCKTLAIALIEFARALQDESVMAFANKWHHHRMREVVVKEAASVYPISISEFDKDPYILNCQNGTLNLRTGAFYDHTPDDLLTKMAGVNYDPHACCVRWEQHIREVMLDDIELMLYLQKALGYALTGSAKYECLFILFGRTTRNGKGLTMETTNRMLGGYARPCSAATIAQKQFCNSSGPSEDIASLAGARFINIPEPGKNMVLDAELVKTLTGNDKIVARFLHENSFAFYLTGKLFINTNYLPRISDATLFSSGRIKVIPFNREFEEDEQDKELKEEFAKPENLSGILNWFIEGWNLLEQQGFDEPRAVKEATEAYRQDSDKIGLFMSELMVEDDAGLTPITDAYGEYQHWCYKNGYKVENVSSFKKGLGPHVEVKRKRPGGLGRLENPVWCICGYRLRVSVNIPVAAPAAPEGEQEPEERAYYD